MTSWTDFVKAFAAKKGISYGCALSDPAVSAGYAATKPPKAPKKAKAPTKTKAPTKKALKADLAKLLSVPSFV